jgi:hypothetical protein
MFRAVAYLADPSGDPRNAIAMRSTPFRSWHNANALLSRLLDLPGRPFTGGNIEQHLDGPSWIIANQGPHD